MKGICKKIVTLLLAFSFVISTAAFPVGAEETTGSGEIALNHSTKTVYVGKKFRLTLNNAPAKIKWYLSMNKDVATVSKTGIVTGVSAGTCKIKVKCNEIKYNCIVTVKDPYIKVSDDYVRVGKTLKAKVKGDTVTSFTSSDPSVLTVDNEGVITAVKKGSADITANCESGKNYTVKVNAYDRIKIKENPTFDDLAPTTHMSFEELVGDAGNVGGSKYNDENGYPKYMPYPDTYKIIVDLYWKVVMVYTKDDNGKYTVPVRYMLCSVGKSSTPTRTGTFKMLSTKNRFAYFSTGDVAQYWSLIVSATYFHSILYTAINANTWTSTSWNNLGNAVSHGCIRLPVPDARWIYYNAAPGTEVTIRTGSSSDTATKAIREQLKLAKEPASRPNLKKGEIPWTDNWKVEDVPQEVKFTRHAQGSGI